MKLAAYVPMLLDRFPAEAFTAASLEHVAHRAVKGFPTYGELTEWLGAWWKEHRPPLRALPPPDLPKPRPPPTPEEIAYVHQRVQDCIAGMRMPIAFDTEGRPIDAPSPPPTPRYLSLDQLDALNPLPNGRKRAPPPEPPT